MNERIIEFARQTGFKVNWQHEDVQAIKIAQYKEFAELIVRECADVVNYYHSRNESVTPRQILQHFGVEE